MSPTVFVLGLDGMSLGALERLVDGEHLPAATAVVADGHRAPLASTIPSYTVPGWASAFTGVDPGEHGLLWWRASGPTLPWSDDEEPGFVRLDDARRPTVWSILSAADARVAVVDVPATFPAPRVNGVSVSGFLAPWPHPASTWPDDVAARVAGWHAPHPAERDGGPSAVAAEIAEMTDEADERTAFVGSLLGEGYDVIVHVLVGPDRINHRAWRSLVPPRSGGADLDAAIRGYWAAVDRAFANARDVLESGGSVLVCSDHGSAPPPPMRFHTRAWLAERGYVERSTLARGLPPWATTALRAARSHAGDALRRLRPSKPGRSFGIAMDGASVVDAVLGDREIGFFVRPSLDASRREELVRSLVASLREIDHDGRSVFAEADAAERFLGPVADGVPAPDVIAVTSEPFSVTPGSALDRSEPVAATQDRGIHHRDGVVAGAGAAFELEAPCGVADVAPTVLALAGVRAPDWMTGRARVATSTGARAVADVPEAAVGTVDVDTAEIEAHLRGLGYLE